MCWNLNRNRTFSSLKVLHEQRSMNTRTGVCNNSEDTEMCTVTVNSCPRRFHSNPITWGQLCRLCDGRPFKRAGSHTHFTLTHSIRTPHPSMDTYYTIHTNSPRTHTHIPHMHSKHTALTRIHTTHTHVHTPLIFLRQKGGYAMLCCIVLILTFVRKNFRMLAVIYPY